MPDVNPFLIDTHCHLQFPAYKDDRTRVIEEAFLEHVWMIFPGTDLCTSKDALALASQHKTGAWSTVGLHPSHIFPHPIDPLESYLNEGSEVFDYSQYKTLAQDKKVVSIGECGLDYARLEEVAQQNNVSIGDIQQRQREVYKEHLKLAQELHLPIITHCRASSQTSVDAYDDVLSILDDFPEVRGVIHCYTGDLQSAKKFLERGFFLSFTGIITFQKTAYLADIIKQLPATSFLIETDAPYLTPMPFRGRRNHPIYVRYIAKRIADIRGVSLDEIARQTVENTKTLFEIKVTAHKTE